MNPTGTLDGLARVRAAPTGPWALEHPLPLAGAATVVLGAALVAVLSPKVAVVALCAVLLLVAMAAVAQLRVVQRRQLRRATVAERERVARELHDGVAQELVHVLAQARRVQAQQPTPESARLLAAATRAYDESRTAISSLRAPVGEALDTSLERVAAEQGRRLELVVRVQADPAVAVDAATQHALLRIVGEALANAARHGGARHATVELRDGRRRRLTVRDDGCGFDPREIPDGCFGLVTMRERAAVVGATVEIRSEPDAGTEVEVTLP